MTTTGGTEITVRVHGPGLTAKWIPVGIIVTLSQDTYCDALKRRLTGLYPSASVSVELKPRSEGGPHSIIITGTDPGGSVTTGIAEQMSLLEEDSDRWVVLDWDEDY